MLTTKAFGYLATAYVFIFLSLILRTSWLTIFVVPIAVLLFVSMKLPKLDANDLSIVRQIQPARSIVGEDVNVILTVTNKSNRKISALSVEDIVPAELEIGSGTNRLMLSLARGESVRFEYSITKPPRGNYAIGPSVIRQWDMLGLRTADIRISGADELMMLPQIERLGVVDLKGKRFAPWPGLVESGRIGIGSEFFEISPYVSGDDLRRVNWKASARSAMLVTNQYESEQVIDVLVVLDCSEAVRSRLFDYDALEFQVSFAASLCSQLIGQGNRVGLSVYGAVRTWVSLGFGKRHLLNLLESLALIKPGQATLPIKYVVESVVAAVLPVRSLVILISPIMGDEVVDMVGALSSQGYNTVCFTVSTRSTYSSEDPAARIAMKILAVERHLRMIRAKRITQIIQISPQVGIKSLLRGGARWTRP